MALTGCLLTIDDSLVDRNDAGTTDASPTLDAGSEAIADASSDVSTPPDAKSDAVTPDAGFCPKGAVFCDDFQSGSLSKWAPSGDFSSYGAVQSDPTIPGNQALHLTVPSMGNAWSSHADILVTVPASGDVTISMKLMVNASSGEIFPFGLFWSGLELAYRFGSPVKLTEQGSTPFAAYDAPAPTANQWTTVTLVVHRAAGYVDVTAGANTKRCPASGMLGGAADLSKTQVHVDVGNFYAPSGTSWSGWIDDVLVTSP